MAPVTGSWVFESLQVGYKFVCENVLRYGDESSPRGMKTKEYLCPTVMVEKPHDCLPVGLGRGVSLKVAAVEAVQLCGAFHDPELMVAASDHFERFREPYTRMMHGAYGNRISVQARYVVNKLSADRDSRQAVVTLWNPGADNLEGKRDYPCTVSLQFLIRDDKLICVTNMRSNDVWLGLAYDMFQFGQLQWTIANMLGCEVGWLVHRPVSLHAYEHNWEAIENLREIPEQPGIEIFGFRSTAIARRIGYDRQTEDDKLTESEDWYVEQLAPLFRRKRERRRGRETS